MKFTGEGFSGDLANIDCEKLICDETLGGRDFILSKGAIVGVCTQRLKLPATCTEAKSVEQAIDTVEKNFNFQIVPISRESAKLGIDDSIGKLKKFQCDTNSHFRKG